MVKVRYKMIHMLFAIARPFRKIYWFLFRPKTRGAKCVIVHDGKVLMIRNTYGKRFWTFPGGYVEHGEAPADGARREALEEVGMTIGDMIYLGEYSTTREYKHDTVYIFVARVEDPSFVIDPIEIAEASWIDIDNLPAPRGQYAEYIIGKYKDWLGS